MKDELAEKLLVTVMDWDTIRTKQERAVIQDMARYKYDEYQQFAPGMRFVESLARWLSQFDPQHREAAYQFVRQKLVFCSSAEIGHLVNMAYGDRLRPHLIRSAAEAAGLNPRHVARIVNSTEFKVRQRQCLFLGLSDGARVDMFRRANGTDLSNEQVSRSHELADHRIGELLADLDADLQKIAGPSAPTDPKFRTLFLLDDFSASGRSYYMPKPGVNVGGKIGRFFDAISDPSRALSELVNLSETEVYIVLYVATDQAREHLEQYSQQVWGGDVARVQVEVVQRLPDSIRLDDSNSGPLRELIRDYYDDSIHDEHLQKGGTSDARFGFAACGLPLVMHHNTPNNSIALLWSYEDTEVRGLFPRVRRHKSGK